MTETHLDGDGGSHPGSLAGDGAGHHVPHGGVAGPVPGHGPPSHQEVVDGGRDEDAVRDLEISPTRRQD